MTRRSEALGSAPLIAGLALVSAREVLKVAAEEGHSDEIELALQRAIEEGLEGARELCEAAGAEGERDSMDERDACAVDYLLAFGREQGEACEEHALNVADEWRQAATERWTEYTRQQALPGVSGVGGSWAKWADARAFQARLAKALGIILWQGKLRREAAAADRSKPAAGVIVAVATGMVRVSTPQLTLGLDETGNPAVFRPDPRNRAEGTRIPVADGPIIPVAGMGMEVIGAATGLLAEPDRNDMLRVLGSRYALPVAEAVLEFSQTRELRDGVTISGEGAWVGFSSWVKVTQAALSIESPHPDDVRNVRLAAWAWARTPIRWPDGAASSALWVLDDETPRPGAPAHGPTFTLSERVQRNATWRAREGRERLGAAEWAMLRIVPLMNPRVYPFVPGSNRRSYGPQTAFGRLLFSFFTRNGRHLLEPPHGVPVTPADLKALAEEAQLPTAVADKILDHLVAVNVIRSPAPGYYVPANEEAKRFIVEGWRNSLLASSAGKASAAKRMGQRRKLAKS